MISIIGLLIVISLSILITRIATIALTCTGLSKEVSRFQARSAFTGVGFTTSESEKVVGHPVRRRVLLLLMLRTSDRKKGSALNPVYPFLANWKIRGS